jgi:hypothetical protein
LLKTQNYFCVDTCPELILLVKNKNDDELDSLPELNFLSNHNFMDQLYSFCLRLCFQTCCSKHFLRIVCCVPVGGRRCHAAWRRGAAVSRRVASSIYVFIFFRIYSAAHNMTGDIYVFVYSFGLGWLTSFEPRSLPLAAVGDARRA